VVLHSEELTRPQVGVAGVDRGGVDLDPQSGLLRHLGDVNLAIDVGEAATHLGHQVAGDELERRVRRVDHPGPDLGHLAAIDDPGSRGWQ
jgi:hypothetical protein